MVANIFSQLMGLKGRLNAQSTLDRITREIQRVTKLQGQKTRQMNAFKRAATNDIRTKYSIFNNQNYFTQNALATRNYDALLTNGKLDNDLIVKNQAMFNAFMNDVNQQRQTVQNMQQQELQNLEEEIAYREEVEIEPLKEWQADLEAEKAVAQAQLEIAKGQEDQSKQFAQDNIKRMFS